MSDRKLIVASLVINVLSLGILVTATVKALQAQAKVETLQTQVKNTASKIPIIGKGLGTLFS